MAGTTRTVRIFLSSPGDVGEERTQARELLLGLARGPFVRGRIHIDVVSWDDEHGGATMDARYTPQQAVDRSLPMPGECDLTVVLLWGRMGTPLTETTADGTPYLSGTEWEFDDALSANKPVLLYRRAEKVLLDPDAPDFDDRLAQKRRVDAFFARFTSESGGLLRSFATYTSADDLLHRLRHDVERYLAELLSDADDSGDARREATPRPSSSAPKGRSLVPVAYREWVKRQHGGVDLLGLQLKKGRPPSLSSIYVPQTTIANSDESEAAFIRNPISGRMDAREYDDTLASIRSRACLVLTRLATESLYVSGAPGTGKSTFCRWAAWLVAEGAIPSLDVPPPDYFAERLDDGLAGRLPLLLRLREFWEYLPPRVGALTIHDLENAISRWAERTHPDGLDAENVRSHLRHGSALLLFDGLDEVPVRATTPAGKWHPRQQLTAALTDACPHWMQAGNRLLLTSRPYGLSANDTALTELGLAPLKPLPGELQRLLALRWFTVLLGSATAAADTADELFGNVTSQPWLRELAANPLLLTAMCIVFDEGKRLPQDKHELYERVVATVLHSRYHDPADIDRAKRHLGAIAYGMHTGAGLGEARTTPQAEATLQEADLWLQRYLELKDYTEQAEASAFDAREALLSHSGLFLSTGARRAGFAHLSFQEFFAAQRAFAVDDAKVDEAFLQYGSVPEWRNTLSFLFGRVLATFTEPTKALGLLRRCLASATASDVQFLLVLTDAALVLTGKGLALPTDILQGLQALLVNAVTLASDMSIRVEVGNAMGILGDPRFRAERLWLPHEDLLGFVEIAAGTFAMGSDLQRDANAKTDEQPMHTVELPQYFIGRYPVTVAQFGVFVEECGIVLRNPDKLRGVPNQPITAVSFGEALAFTKWLSDKLRKANWTPEALRERLTSGWCITLPSEAEWEKAARGQDGRINPWGDAESMPILGTTMSLLNCIPVGIDTTRQSPYGVLDMACNVPEWTRSLLQSYPYQPGNINYESDVESPHGHERVMRGGSWIDPAPVCRVAARNELDFRSELNGAGFRVVLRRV